MIGFHPRLVHHKVTLFADFQAEIHIVERHGKLFLKSAHRLVDTPLYHQACRRDRRVIQRKRRLVQISAARSLQSHKHILSDAARIATDSDNNSRMLHGIIRIIQLRSHDTDLPALAGTKHLFEPVFGNHLDVIVHKHQIFALCMRNAEIVERRIIKPFLPDRHADPLSAG